MLPRQNSPATAVQLRGRSCTKVGHLRGQCLMSQPDLWSLEMIINPTHVSWWVAYLIEPIGFPMILQNSQLPTRDNIENEGQMNSVTRKTFWCLV